MDGNADKINKYISIGTPYMGSPKVPYIFSTGRLLDNLLTADLSATSAQSIAEGMKCISSHTPSVYQLLPYRYNSYATVKSSLTNIRDAELFNGPLHLINSRGNEVSSTVKRRFINNAINFMDSLYVNGRHAAELVDSYIMVGRNVETINKVEYSTVLIEGGIVTRVAGINYLEMTKSGDGTVPYWSASLNGKLTTINYLDRTHIGLISDNEVINDIISIGSPPMVSSPANKPRQ